MTTFISNIAGLVMSRSAESPAKAIFAGSVILATASYAAYSFLTSNKSSDLEPALTPEEAREMMKEINDAIKGNASRLLRAAEGIKQQIVAQGQEIEDSQLLKAFILPHLETTINEIQEEVLSKHEADEDELEEAVSTYLDRGDSDLEEIVKSMKIIYKQFGGAVEEDESTGPSMSSKDLALSEFMQLVHDLVNGIVDETNTMVKNYVATHGKPTSSTQKNHFQAELKSVSEAVEKMVLGRNGLAKSDFQEILLNYQNEPALQQAFMAMQYQTQRILQSYGIFLN